MNQHRRLLNAELGLKDGYLRFDEWWYRRRNIYLHIHLLRLWIGCTVNGGDGINVLMTSIVW